MFTKMNHDLTSAVKAFGGRSKTTLFFLSFLLSVSSAWAQKSVKFSGKIVDSSSRSAVVGATVKLLKANKAATSDVEGKFIRQSGGRGQYGDCWIEMSPMPRGEGYLFEDKIVGGVINQFFK